ncbi:hypothetical protein G4B88_009795 [Cannabis sativa]|uniref:J domain-containing protein n=1 Tax=Cannabis sativa TaxID=3483 RepID=A0A7J6E309_CANSA|nr:hypothetical protein G4B88_009795 [Cannabis sativa]
MDVYEDHYEILGLPSGKNGAKITLKEITKAYKAKALLLHPDKNPFDSKAKAKFQRLKSSYDVLKDDNTRKLFDKKLSNIIAKRRKMESDLARVAHAIESPTTVLAVVEISAVRSSTSVNWSRKSKIMEDSKTMASISVSTICCSTEK